MKLLKDKLLVAGPAITEVELSTLLETTGKKFRDGKWAFGKNRGPKKASSQSGRRYVPVGKSKGAHIEQAGVLKDTVPRGIQQPLPPPRGKVSRSVAV